ncbi:Uncharacterized protein FWK35_00003529, partial [Aphis craccivora]
LPCLNNASISNLRGGFRWQSKYPWCLIEVKSKHFPTVFKKIKKNKIKVTKKQEFLRKTNFRSNRIFYMVSTQKIIIVKILPNVYISVIYIQLIFKIFWLFFELLIDN